MNLPREKGLYKNAGVKHPRILYEVWKSDDGKFLVDIWKSDTENKGAVYKIDDTMSLDFFENKNKDKLERFRVRYKVYDNVYLNVWKPKKEKELTQLKQLMYKYKREAIQLIEGDKMNDIITVEFSRKKLKKLCPLTDWCKTCDKSDWQLLDCHMNEVSYKIKEKKKIKKKKIRSGYEELKEDWGINVNKNWDYDNY